MTTNDKQNSLGLEGSSPSLEESSPGFSIADVQMLLEAGTKELYDAAPALARQLVAVMEENTRLTAKLDNKEIGAVVYCEKCGNCGEPGCCPPAICEYVSKRLLEEKEALEQENARLRAELERLKEGKGE